MDSVGALSGPQSGSGAQQPARRAGGAPAGRDRRSRRAQQGRRDRTLVRWEARAHKRGERLMAPLRAIALCVGAAAWVLAPGTHAGRPDVVWALAAFAACRLCVEGALLVRRLDLADGFPTLSAILDQAWIVAWVGASGAARSPFAPLFFLGVMAPMRLAPVPAALSFSAYIGACLLVLGPAHWFSVTCVAILGVGLYAWVRMTEQDRWMADTDGLTELFNHRYARLLLDGETAGAGAPCALIALDLDGFKQFNDTCGHPAGDAALGAVARRLRQASPPGAVLARMGGDEFAAILPGADRREALEVAERLRRAVNMADLRAGDGTRLPLTASVGTAVFPADAGNADELIAAADRALYGAKRAGGNAVAAAEHETRRALAAHGPTLDALAALALAVEPEGRDAAARADYASRLAVRVGARLGLGEDDLRQLRIGTALHDVGKIGIPDAILRKPGALTPEERAVVRRHAELGHMLLKEVVPGLERVLQIARQHHERYDGGGYPDGLRAGQIERTAQIVGAVDAFLAMTADRPYRSRLSPREALAEIHRCAGSQFDPEVVAALAAVLAGPPV